MSEPAIRKLPPVEERVETGAVQFGDDWPGYFIRGDNAFHIVLCIRQIEDIIAKHNLSIEAFLPLSGLTGLKDDIVRNTIVNGPKTFASLITEVVDEEKDRLERECEKARQRYQQSPLSESHMRDLEKAQQELFAYIQHKEQQNERTV